MGALNRVVKGLARAGVPAVNEGGAAFVFKSVAVRFHRIVMVNFKPLPPPSVIQLAFVLHDPVDLFDHAVQRAGKSKLTKMR